MIFVIGLLIVSVVITHAYELWRAANNLSEPKIADLVKMTKRPGRDWWTGTYDDEIERGVVLLKNGELIRFAFISHHVSRDKSSHAYFQGEKYRKFVRGYFCCEVAFESNTQPQNVDELDILLSKVDGTSP